MAMKKKLALCLALALIVSAFAGCGGSKATTSPSAAASTAPSAAASAAPSTVNFKVSMVTDTGGINDQSFNQSAWEGLQALQKNTGAQVNYVESKQAADFTTNMENMADNGANLVWGIGYACADALLDTAKKNPDISFAIVDNSYDTVPSNVTCLMFKAQESSFLVGYVAGKTTKTDKVGFVGGIESGLLDAFMYGYEAGVAYAGKEIGKDITVSTQWAESFSDSAKGKAIAQKMFSDGCDIVYHAAGGTGTGVIEAAKEANKFAIGVDRDQAYLAPDNVLTSALKLVGTAVEKVSTQALKGDKVGGQTITYGLKDGCVGIPTTNKNMDPAVYTATMAIQDKIIAGTITPPTTKAEYDTFVSGLK